MLFSIGLNIQDCSDCGLASFKATGIVRVEAVENDTFKPGIPYV